MERVTAKSVMQVIEVYATRHCPYCACARALLKRKGLSFIDLDIAGNWKLRDEMIQRAHGHSSVPQIFIDNKHIGGFAELQDLDRSGELDILIHRTTI
jgi:glutaredoxin 3